MMSKGWTSARVFWVAAAALAFTTCELTSDPVEPTTPLLDTAVEEFVTLVNAHRESVGCGILMWHAATAEVARLHSEDMVTRSFFSHTNPDGLSPFDRLAVAGVTYRLAGENIAAGYPSASAVLDGWLNSPGHRANIENCGFTHHGVGLVESHWTHVFVTPN